MWKHGFGILEPKYTGNNPSGFSWEAELDAQDVICADGCPIKTFFFEESNHINHRAILFRESDKTYLNNKQMVEAFKQIVKNVLNGKK